MQRIPIQPTPGPALFEPRIHNVFTQSTGHDVNFTAWATALRQQQRYPRHGPPSACSGNGESEKKVGGKVVELKWGFVDTFCTGGLTRQLAPRAAPEPSKSQSCAPSTAPERRLRKVEKVGGKLVVKIGVCRHFLQRGPNTPPRAESGTRSPKNQPRTPITAPECQLRKVEKSGGKLVPVVSIAVRCPC